MDGTKYDNKLYDFLDRYQLMILNCCSHLICICDINGTKYRRKNYDCWYKKMNK